jgi:hypothetical protein
LSYADFDPDHFFRALFALILPVAAAAAWISLNSFERPFLWLKACLRA